MFKPPRILLVDDDRALVDVLSMALADEGFEVQVARDGRAGWEAFVREAPDLVLLDLLMPELDGLQLCKRIRAEHGTPIVMLTSRSEEMDKVLGLELGADDYVAKPFSIRELVARLRAVLRRSREPRLPETAQRRDIEGIRIDRERRQVWVRDIEVRLTSHEFELLWTLTERPQAVLSRDALMDSIYGQDVVVAPRTIDTFVKRLRQKLSQADPSFDAIETVRGVGYRFRGG